MTIHKDTFYVRARPQITNISNLVKQQDRSTTHVILGHGFWSNEKKLTLTTSTFSGVETTEPVSPLFGRLEHEQLRAFAVPITDLNTFGVPLTSYNLYESAVLETDSAPVMTTKFPAFDGIELTPEIINENTLSVTLPPASGDNSLIDIIISNRAGYGRASVDLNQSSDQTAYVQPTSGMVINTSLGS